MVAGKIYNFYHGFFETPYPRGPYLSARTPRKLQLAGAPGQTFTVPQILPPVGCDPAARSPTQEAAFSFTASSLPSPQAGTPTKKAASPQKFVVSPGTALNDKKREEALRELLASPSSADPRSGEGRSTPETARKVAECRVASGVDISTLLSIYRLLLRLFDNFVDIIDTFNQLKYIDS